MKAVITVGKLRFEIDSEDEKQIFRDIAKIEEVFGEENCGKCKSDDIKFNVRTVTKTEKGKSKVYEYFEMRCNKCGSVLSYGQHQEGGTLFPKRKKVEVVNGEEKEVWDKDHKGWKRYEKPKDE